MSQTTVPQRRSRLPSRSLSSSNIVDCGGCVSNNNSRRSWSMDSAGFGEVCGGATAETAAVCCCVPFGIANFLVSAIYKIPAGLCRRAIRQRQRRKLLKKGLIQPWDHRGCEGGGGLQIHPVEELFPAVNGCEETEKAADELEKEMWERLYGTGFWRSPSQREGDSPTKK